MSKNLIHCLEKLKFIAAIKDPIRRKRVLMTVADPCLYLALNEIAINTVKGKVKLYSSQKLKLNKYTKVIKGLSVKTRDKNRRKRLLNQSGGFLPILIPAIASVITSLIESKS